MATFGYGRVSTSQQDTENQRLELGQAGWQIDYWFADVVSGKVPAMQRKAFSEMLNKIRDGETLVVAKLDRLGRDAIDVLQTGLSRAKAEGKKLGRPPKIASEARREILEKKNSGLSISALARQYGVSRATVAAITD